MTIYTDTTHILLTERIADLRREADTERMLRTALLAGPSRRPFRPLRGPRPVHNTTFRH